MNRVSAFTGVPTVLGWRNHEGQWRRGVANIGPLMDYRSASANAWLNGTPPNSYDYPEPRFVIFGAQEMDGSATCELLQPRSPEVYERLALAGWQLAFESGDTRVYTRIGDPALLPAESSD
jgi:hypothetical protein